MDQSEVLFELFNKFFSQVRSVRLWLLTLLTKLSIIRFRYSILELWKFYFRKWKLYRHYGKRKIILDKNKIRKVILVIFVIFSKFHRILSLLFYNSWKFNFETFYLRWLKTKGISSNFPNYLTIFQPSKIKLWDSFKISAVLDKVIL